MCDMMDCLKKVHKLAVRNLEDVIKEIEDNDDEMDEEMVTKVHRLLDIIKDGEKMKELYSSTKEGE